MILIVHVLIKKIKNKITFVMRSLVGEGRGMHRVLVGKPEGTRPLGE
jgi:hypothetical protein